MAERSFGMLCGRNILPMAKLTGYSNQVLTTWDDMIAANMPKASVEDAYQQEFGTKPNQVHLNDEFCTKHGWLSYNYLGELRVTGVGGSGSFPGTVVNEHILRNDTDEPYERTVTLTTIVSISATVQVTNSSSISIGNPITVESKVFGMQDKFPESFTFSNEVGSSSTQSTSAEISDTVNVTVPPHSSVRVYLEVPWMEETQSWEMPVDIDEYGLTGAQFPRPVGSPRQDCKAVSHGIFFSPPFQSKMMGTMRASYNNGGGANVDPPKAL